MHLRSKTSSKSKKEEKLGTNQYYIDEVVNRRKNHAGQYEYLAKWSGYSSSDNTWEPRENLPNNMVHDYEASLRKAKDRKRRARGLKRRASQVAAPPKQKRKRTEGGTKKGCSSAQGHTSAPEVGVTDVGAEVISELSSATRIVDPTLLQAPVGAAVAFEPWLLEVTAPPLDNWPAQPVEIAPGELDNLDPDLFNFDDLITFPALEELLDVHEAYLAGLPSVEGTLGEMDISGGMNTPPQPFPETFTPLAVFGMRARNAGELPESK